MTKSPADPAAKEKVPAGFKVDRKLPLGRHPLLTAFPGLDQLATATRHEPDAGKRIRLHADTCIELVADDLWMYVAPHDVPKMARGRWKPVVSPGSDCIVVGESHLRTSPDLILFMDIFHELCHIRQRRDGAELWDDKYSYVERPTEVEAYKFVVDEARRLRVKESVLREYLKVEWIDDSDFQILLTTMGVSSA